MSELAIDVRGLTKRYGSRAVVNDVTLQVDMVDDRARAVLLGQPAHVDREIRHGAATDRGWPGRRRAASCGAGFASTRNTSLARCSFE